MKMLIKTIMLTFLFLNISEAQQLVEIKKANMHPEAPIYEDSNGIHYSTLVRFESDEKITDLGKDNSKFKEDKILKQQIKLALKDIRKNYGDFTISKTFPNAVWGDTVRKNKRTGKTVNILDLSQIYDITFQEPVPIDEIIHLLENTPNILYAEGPLEYYFAISPNDTYYAEQYNWAYNVMNAEDAWSMTTGSSNINIGIHDYFPYGDTLHIELQDKAVWIDTMTYYGGHGALVAGIAAGETNNNQGIASLGWNCSLSLAQHIPFRNIDDLVVDGAVDIINFSWYTTSYSPPLAKYCRNALLSGVILVAATGNDENTPPFQAYPAAYNFGEDGEVLAVSTTILDSGEEIRKVGFNYAPGTNPLTDSTAYFDFAAPSGDVMGLSWYYSDQYDLYTQPGTSVSAPFVSGLIGLMLTLDNTLEVDEIKDILKKTTDLVGTDSYDANNWNRYLGYGRIDAANALNVVSGNPSKPRGLAVIDHNDHPCLSWDANPEGNIAGYYIYRQENSSAWQQIDYVSAPTTAYMDTDVDTQYPTDDYSYKLKAKDTSNNLSTYSLTVTIEGQMPKRGGEDTDNDNVVPAVFCLEQNYPNPFNPTTMISYSLPENSNVTLKVYDIMGREIKTLISGNQQAGNHNITWDGTNQNGEHVSSGTYIYRFTALSPKSVKEVFTQSGKMLLIK